MMPHGAPTTRFSTLWHRMASCRPSSATPSAPHSAPMAATSTAALLDTPLASGTQLDCGGGGKHAPGDDLVQVPLVTADKATTSAKLAQMPVLFNAYSVHTQVFSGT